MTNYNFLFIIVTILVTNNFLFFKFVSKFVTIVINNFWSQKLVTNNAFSCSVYTSSLMKTIKSNCTILDSNKIGMN